jgi:Spy/CpxP family protein refolding chaperone
MKDGIESLGRVRAQGIALVIVAFVAGGLGGMALERVRAAGDEPHMRPRVVRMHDGLPPGFADLELTADQRQRIHAIMEARRHTTDSVLEASLPRLRATFDSVREEIRAVLTPEQRERFDAMEPRMRHRPGGRRGPGSRGGAPGEPPPEVP